MRFALIATSLLFASVSFAQTPTAEEILEKSIKATGGREAHLKMTSMAAKGTLEIVAMGASASTEMYAKAPDKRASVTIVDGYGEIRSGYDGKIGWSSEPQNGLVELSGEMLAQAKRDAQFHGDLNWKENNSKVEVTGKEKVGDKDAYVVKMTPKEGKPTTRYYDAASGLLLKAVTTVVSPQGEAEVPIEMSDYKDLGNGVKVPHTLKITMPGIGDLITRFSEYKFNVDLDDAKFAKPKN